jgi:hypothetical protein
MDDYEVAKKALQHAVDHPDAFSADDIESFTKIVEGGKASAAPAEKVPSTQADFGEHSSLGPTGLDIGSPADIQLEQTRLGHEGRQKAEMEHPKIAKALSAAGVTPGMPVPSLDEQKRQRREALDVYNNDLPSASRRKDLFEPPEYTPPQSLAMFPGQMGYQNFAQGKVKIFTEPSVDEFHAELGPVYGEKILREGKESDAYKEFADTKWKHAVEQAKEKGIAAVRNDYRSRPDPHVGVTQQIAGLLGSGIDAATFGLGSKLIDKAGEDAPMTLSQAKEGASPLATGAGTLGGSLMNPAFLAAEAAIPVKGALSGAAAAGLGAGSNSLLTSAGRAATGEDVSPGEAAKSALLDTALGGTLGFVGGAASKEIAKKGEELGMKSLEEGGYAKPSLWSGIRPTEKITEAEGAAKKFGFQDAKTGKPLVVDMEATRLEKPFVEEARARQASGKEFGSRAEKEIYEANKRLRVSARPIVDALEEAKASRLDREGRPRTSVAARDIKTIDREIQNYLDPELSEMAGEPVARLYDPKEIDQVIKDIQSLDPKALQRGAPTGRQPLPDFESIKQAAHQLRDQIPGGTSFVPEGLETTMVDDLGKKRTLKDYSAFKHESAKDIAAGARARGMIGLPEGTVPETLGANESRSLQSSLRKVGESGPGQHEADQVIEDFARATGKTKSVDLMKAYKAYERLKEQAKIMGRLRLGGLHPQESLSGHGMALRLQAAGPTLGKAGRLSGAIGKTGRQYLPPLMAGRFGSELQGPEEPLTLDEVNRRLDPFGSP